ncbi:MAG: Phosphoribosylaminoimidazole-succinocarboxamide synthase [Methanosaeta sp. PtaB.Bin039]|nr:MAG: Phosphoribosylaminoimidazole-succinocarboxamide synthase [Methanosaeta sp. PtaB.Bin039]HOT06871.1 phosphoribosylaminoimidazolesuccinocarboxamide synthase [Methanotrichaceae archaeon]HQF16767.1 phosphoribosylaminoimidazolesuccinocarboxamide synthase [Methanotrichaceae archaeon]HQI91399.1 phosphoribosylaminoimidazolesuccinocarboxamide synthase [Methanotrichaceae archaeon]HQJ28635.1 phosphoribosylaminoimidazolesuccinocarboxamide synthase [Methanotrichaceae archaeon]
MDRKLLMKGKVKEAYDLGSELEFQFTDNISVFDKIIPTRIAHKGETLCREGVFWFQRANKMGINTHFLRYLPPAGMAVRKVDIVQPEQLTRQSRGNLIPLEFICRWFVAGSLYDRLRSGEVDPETLGFPAGRKVTYAEPLPEPFVEVSTKLEKIDRLLDQESAISLARISRREFDSVVDIILRIDEDIKRNVEARGLIHVDGKKEFAMDENREPMVIDVYGTADEDRFWDKACYEQGSQVDLSKEYVRQHYRQTGYKDLLYSSRAAGAAEPEIPPLPAEVAEQTSQIYIKLYQMITGEEFVPLDQATRIRR